MQPEPRQTNGTPDAAQDGAAQLAAAATKAVRKTRHTPTPKTRTNTKQPDPDTVSPGMDVSGPQNAVQAAASDPEGRETSPGSRTPQHPMNAVDPTPCTDRGTATSNRPSDEPSQALDVRRLPEPAAELVSAVEPAPVTRGLSLLPATPPLAAEVSMPETVRKALRLSLINQLRAVGAAHRLVEIRQAELLAAFTDAREQGFPTREIERIRGEAVGLGFDNTEYTHLLHLTGWLP